jgi:hypothetical protein
MKKKLIIFSLPKQKNSSCTLKRNREEIVRWNDKEESEVMFTVEQHGPSLQLQMWAATITFFYESVEVLRPEFNITDVPFNRDLSLCYYLNEHRNLSKYKYKVMLLSHGFHSSFQEPLLMKANGRGEIFQVL